MLESHPLAYLACMVATRLTKRLYNQLIHSAYTGPAVPKTFKAFRFDPELHVELKELAAGSGLMVTEAFEKSMEACVSAESITFPAVDRREVEAEARVLLAWLGKG